PRRAYTTLFRSGTPPPLGGHGARDEQVRRGQLRQVLTDRVVVEPEVLRELGDVHRAVRVDDVAEDPVAGRITQRSRLSLQGRHGGLPARPFIHDILEVFTEREDEAWRPHPGEDPPARTMPAPPPVASRPCTARPAARWS